LCSEFKLILKFHIIVKPIVDLKSVIEKNWIKLERKSPEEKFGILNLKTSLKVIKSYIYLPLKTLVLLHAKRFN